MRRKVGIVLGGCAALVLIGSAGAAVLTYTGDEGRQVGTWHEGTPTSRTPMGSVHKEPGSLTSPAPVQTGSTTSVPGATPALPDATPEAAGLAGATPAPTRKFLPESVTLNDSRAENGSRTESARTAAFRTQPESATAAGALAAATGAGTAGTVAAAAAGAGADGRQRVGELLTVKKMLGYQDAAPQTQKFSYPGASYVKLHFDRMAMLPGDYFTVSNADHTESYRYNAPSLPAKGAPTKGAAAKGAATKGAATKGAAAESATAKGAAAKGSAGKWAMSVTGDTAILQMHRAAGDALGLRNPIDTLGVHVDRVARGFTRSEQKAQPESQLLAPGRSNREESVCGADTSTDAACYRSSDPVAYTKSKAIARLLINGTELCTGWRVGPNNRMLTNNHCFTTSEAAYDTEVWFNYQCAQCGSYDVLQPTKVWGGKVLATDHVYDYTLFSVGDFAAVRKFGYLSLDTARPVKGQELYVPQHPAGQPTKIAGALGDKAGNCSVADPGYTGYVAGSDVSYYCDTEGGSSGSPVLSRKTNKVVALHHFGGCPNSGVRADLLAAKLRTLL